MTERIGFIGTGTVGSTLAVGLAEKGYSVVAVTSLKRVSAERLARLISGCKVVPDAQAVADASDVVFIATPDDVIPKTAEQVRWQRGQVVLHCSGALSTKVLEPARRAGASVGSMHPLQTFAAQAINSLAGVTFALEGEGPVMANLKQMSAALGGRWIVVRPEDKALYHIAAVMTSNYVVALVDGALQLWKKLGVAPEDATQAILTLTLGTLHNIEGLGTASGLTGPIARGDVGTVQRHLSELHEKAPELERMYRELGLLTVPLALKKGSINEEQATRLRHVLSPTVSGNGKLLKTGPEVLRELDRRSGR